MLEFDGGFVFQLKANKTAFRTMYSGQPVLSEVDPRVCMFCSVLHCCILSGSVWLWFGFPTRDTQWYSFYFGLAKMEYTAVQSHTDRSRW